MTRDSSLLSWDVLSWIDCVGHCSFDDDLDEVDEEEPLEDVDELEVSNIKLILI